VKKEHFWKNEIVFQVGQYGIQSKEKELN